MFLKTPVFVLFIIMMISSTNILAQKVKIKKGTVFVDGTEYVKVDKEAGNMSVYSLVDGEEIIYMEFNDPTPQNNQNKDAYFVVRFLEYKKEVEFQFRTRKGILKLLYNGKVIQDGIIDKEKMERFISKYGS